MPSERALGLSKAVLDLVETKAALEDSYDFMNNTEETELLELDFNNAIEAFEAMFDAAVETKALQLIKDMK